MKYLHLSLFIILSLTFSNAQSTQKGGFIYGWENFDNNDLTGLGNRIIEWDSTDLVDIVHAPPIGVHPRVYFGPSEIPDIINRLETTKSGQAAKATIHAYTTLLHLGSSYNQNSNYALDAYSNRYIDNSGAWNMEPYFIGLKNNDPNVWDGIDIKKKHRTAALMSLEAFMCLLYPDDFDDDVNLSYATRKTELANAMYFWATLVLGDPNVNPSSNNFNLFGGTHMALCYDLMYNDLSTQQRDTIRAAIAQIIPEHPRHGGDLHAFVNTSNWSTLNSFEIITNLAIEGEEGYQAQMTEEWMRAFHTFITYGWYPSGAGYEGLGKNYQFVTTMIACAKRGYSLLSHPHVRAYGEEFLPAIMQPFGKGFTSYDVWGGSGHDEVEGQYKFNSADAVGLKYAFPNSEKIDFVWRNYISSFYQNNSTGYVYAQVYPDDSYNNYLIPAAVFSADYDESTTWQTQADQNISENYIAMDRGLAVFKSGSDSFSLAVQFHARQDMGGHTHGDRLDFTMSSLGRIWIRKSYGGSQFQTSKFHSMVLIDDLGVPVGDPDGDKCRQPATILNHSITDELSQISADATYPYMWDWHWSPQSETSDHPWLGNNGWEKVTETWNDFLTTPQSEAHFDIPFYDYPHWHQPNRYERMVKRIYNPMEKVVRNIGLIKGENPMLLIVDDVKKDDDIHSFKWTAQIARDLEVDSYDINLNDNDYRCDIILKEPEAEGNRRLLVRVLEIENYDGSTPPGVVDTLDYIDYFTGNPFNPNPNWERMRLVVESNSVSPNFKVLLFPYEEGAEKPMTNWNSTKDTLQILFSNEEKNLAFSKNGLGNTQFEIIDPTSTSVSNFVLEKSVFVFPNPTTAILNIQSQLEIQNVEIFDAFGKRIFGKKVSDEKVFQISTTTFPSGIYFLKLKTKSGVSISKRVVVRN